MAKRLPIPARKIKTGGAWFHPAGSGAWRPALPVIALPVTALMAAPLPARCAAQAQTLHFDVRFGIFRPARVRLDITEDARRYAASGVVRSSGILRFLRPFHFDLHAEGSRDGGELRPERYVGDMDTGWRQVRVEMRFDGTTPRIERISPDEPERPWSVRAEDMDGSVDLMTALYRAARPQTRDKLCDWSLETFDGRRHARIALQGPRGDGAGQISCDGAYLRVGGYSPEELADRRAYPFTLTYAAQPDGTWRLQGALAQSPYGRVRLDRTEGP